MIPKLASFYWCGGPLPWLRAQSMVSFKRLHPDWEVVLGSPDELEVPEGVTLELDRWTDSRLKLATRSDVWRWRQLAERGGVYADTDVVFVAPIGGLFEDDCDAWITQDQGTPVPASGSHLTRRPSDGRYVFRSPLEISIGVLAARLGSVFFSRVYERAKAMGPSEDYQSHGTTLLAARWFELTEGLQIGQIPGVAFYRGYWEKNVQKLWKPGAVLPGELGIHWYGGSPSSGPFQGVSSSAELPPSLVRDALELRTRPGAPQAG